jgi:hypothetical protein
VGAQLDAVQAKTSLVNHLDLERDLDFDLGDPNRSFAGSATREPKDPSDLHQVFHGSGAEFTTGDSGKRLRE